MLQILGILALISFIHCNEYTIRENAALAKVKSKAGDTLKVNYFKDDYIIIHFLRANKLDVEKTIQQMRKTATWRKKNQIDTIDSEPILEHLYPAHYVGVDKAGRPLVLFAPTKWNVRNIILNGGYDKLILKYAQFFERGHLSIQKLRGEGKNVTQCQMIQDIISYNLRQHACLRCFPSYIQYLLIYEDHYPQIFYRYTAINIPRIFLPLLNLLKSLASEYTNKNLHTFGSNKLEYQRELFKTIEPSELLEEFGGTRKL